MRYKYLDSRRAGATCAEERQGETIEVMRFDKRLAAILLLLAWTPSPGAAQTVVLQERIESAGVIQAVGRGTVEVVDLEGTKTEYKIQEKDQPGISLGGAEILVRFPAKVSVTGTLSADQLSPGMLVQFAAQLNRLGRAKGVVQQIVVFDEGTHTLGINVDQPPQSSGDFGQCTIRGEVFSYRDGRMVVTVPPNDYARNARLSFRVDERATVRVQSDDYHRARRGDRVARMVAARFSTGDVAIQELEIELASVSEGPEKPSAAEAKYRHLSDEPRAPRDVRSAHFLLHTDVSDRQSQVLLDSLETMIALVSQYYGRPPQQTIECYVVRDLRGWPAGVLPPEAIAKISEPAGVTLSLSRRTSSGAAIQTQTRSVVFSCDDRGVVRHEAVHAYCGQTFGSTGPTWYAEGMAEMGNYWKKGQLGVEVDPVVIDYLKRSEPKKLLDIVAAGQITGDSWRAYAWRWALCYLLANNPNYSGRFKALGIAMMSEYPGASFESVYGPVAQQVSFEYDLFVQTLDNGYRADLCAWQWGRKFQFIAGTRYATANVIARGGWQASSVKLQAGQSYDCVAKGTWKIADGDEDLDADGDREGSGRLEGVVLTADFRLGEILDLGARGTFIAAEDGDLYLRCREAWNRLDDNDGTITVYFRKTPGS